MVLVQMSTRVLEVKLIGGEHDGQFALIPRITLAPTEGQTGLAFVLKRRQFPVRLAFALTINKAQGQSVKHIGVDLRIPVFSHGQLYVALSRATSGQNICVLLPEEEKDICQTCNVVYPEVLVDTVRLTRFGRLEFRLTSARAGSRTFYDCHNGLIRTFLELSKGSAQPTFQVYNTPRLFVAIYPPISFNSQCTQTLWLLLMLSLPVTSQPQPGQSSAV